MKFSSSRIIAPKSGVCSISLSVLEEAVLDLLGKDVIGETLGAHIGKFIDMDAATITISENVLILSSLMGQIRCFCNAKPTHPKRTETLYSRKSQRWNV